MKTIVIEGQPRTSFGKKSAGKLRADLNIPCVIYGGSSSVSFFINEDSIKELVYTSKFQKAKIVIDGTTYTCVLKDLQFHRITDKLIHVDFLELSDNKKVTVTVPIKFVGTPEGVRTGGKLLIKMKTLKVKTFPRFLVENIEVNIEKLQLNKSIRVENIQIPDLEIINSPRIPVASVVSTRQLKQEEKMTNSAAAVSKSASDAKTSQSTSASGAASKASDQKDKPKK